MIALVGTYTSPKALTVAPLFMMNLIPMVGYGASTSVLSRKQNFPSFLRTVHPSQNVMAMVVKILKHFDWRWVSFLYIDDDYGNDGQELFIKRIEDTEICLAFTKGLNQYTNHSQIFKQIEAQRIGVIIVFAPEWTAEALIESAIQLNITNKVWIAVDGWSLNKELPKKKGIKNIGTVIGVSEPRLPIPGFSDFIHSSRSQAHCENTEQNMVCNQDCNCSSLSAEDVITADPSFNFPVYTAVYAIAHALHNVLQCGAGRCNNNITVYPHMVLAEVKKSNFTLLNHSIQFDENGDPNYGSYSIVFWNQSGDAEEIGFYDFYPPFHFLINDSKIQWNTEGEVPTSVCSQECPHGSVREYDGLRRCCFNCKICSNGTYVNSTEDPYKCIACKETEWSAAGSTSCSLRVVEYIPFTDSGAILIMIGAWALVGLTLAMSVLFAINYNTPVVRSAGGPMCFLILGCLSLCSLSVFFHFGEPTTSFCILRFLPFLLFYTVCLACFVVRSFQIVFIFKIAVRFHKISSWWMKYHVQWLVITVASVTQAVLLIIGYTYAPPRPYHEFSSPDKIILGCDINLKASSGSVALLLLLCSLCFIFSYMGKDLPKNYNEAKAITFCLLLLILTWIIFATVYILYRGKYIPTLKALADSNIKNTISLAFDVNMSTVMGEHLLNSSYRRFQVMRFSVEEINNSTNLLPNVSLGYEIFDHCSDTHNFPDFLNLISVNGLIQPWGEPHKNLSKVIALVGASTSTEARTVAPLFMMNLIPMVSYAASSSIFSRKEMFPSFFRTVHTNQDVVKAVVDIVLHFNWRWIACLYIDGDYGIDGLYLLIERIKDTEICLPYTKALNHNTDHSQIFKQIEAQRIGVIIVFAPEWTVEALIESAIQQNITNKVWIAVDAWSLNKKLPKKKGIKNIGTVIGVAEPRMTIPGFSDFIHSSRSQAHCENTEQNTFCNQVCNCSSLSAEDVIAADPSFNFPVYSAVYAIAHALHNVLQCGAGRCNNNITVYPHMVPTSVCSPECPTGYAQKYNGLQRCCFNCEICLSGTYVNSTALQRHLQALQIYYSVFSGFMFTYTYLEMIQCLWKTFKKQNRFRLRVDMA
ncbi:hypothetical protein ABVT39_002684 [Epinephelus coioides]